MAPTPILAVRVDKATQARWKAGAEERGYELSEFVRSCVESELAPGSPPQPRRDTKATRKDDERKARTGLCPHRLGPGQFCRRCDG